MNGEAAYEIIRVGHQSERRQANPFDLPGNPKNAARSSRDSPSALMKVPLVVSGANRQNLYDCAVRSDKKYKLPLQIYFQMRDANKKFRRGSSRPVQCREFRRQFSLPDFNPLFSAAAVPRTTSTEHGAC